MENLKDDSADSAAVIARLQTKLAEQEHEIQTLKRESASRQECLKSVIAHCTLTMRTVQPSLFQQLDIFNQKLQSNPPSDILLAECQSINSLLTRESLIHEQILHGSNKFYTDILQDLSHLRDIPENLRQDIELLQDQFPLTSMGQCRTFHHRLMQLVLQCLRSIIRRMEILQLDPQQIPSTLVEHIPSQSNHANINEHQPTVERQEIKRTDLTLSQLTPDILNSLHEELQHLITELDFQGNTGMKLANIRGRLIGGVSYIHLPVLALELIALVIDGVRKERQFSFSLIHSLGDKLKSDQAQLQTSLQQASELMYTDFRLDQQSEQTLIQVNQILQQPVLAEWKQKLQAPLSQLEQTLQVRSQTLKQHQEIINQIAVVTDSMKTTEAEVSSYRGKLNHFNQQLQIDTLTQLYNRTALHQRLALEYKRWQRYQTPLCLAIIDIDYFKHINDQYGHLAGDKALKVIARTLHAAFRETDFIARFGGEEFVVLLPGITHNMVDVPLNKLRNTVKSIPFRFKESEISITISIGATEFRSGDHISDVLDRADKALYQAKNAGRDRLVISL